MTMLIYTIEQLAIVAGIALFFIVALAIQQIFRRIIGK